MPAITEDNYPIEDGWNHVEVEVKPGAKMEPSEMERLMAFAIDGFKADLKNFETVVGPQEGLIIKGAIRHTLEGRVAACQQD